MKVVSHSDSIIGWMPAMYLYVACLLAPLAVAFPLTNSSSLVHAPGTMSSEPTLIETTHLSKRAFDKITFGDTCSGTQMKYIIDSFPEVSAMLDRSLVRLNDLRDIIENGKQPSDWGVESRYATRYGTFDMWRAFFGQIKLSNRFNPRNSREWYSAKSDMQRLSRTFSTIRNRLTSQSLEALINCNDNFLKFDKDVDVPTQTGMGKGRRYTDTRHPGKSEAFRTIGEKQKLCHESAETGAYTGMNKVENKQELIICPSAFKKWADDETWMLGGASQLGYKAGGVRGIARLSPEKAISNADSQALFGLAMYYGSCNWSMGSCGNAQPDKICPKDEKGDRLTNEDGSRNCVGFEYT